MRLATAVNPAAAEKVFAVYRNSVTGTTTATAATHLRGAPVVLQTHTDSNDGTWIMAPATATSGVNNLFVGLAANFPDTTTGQTGTWQGEDAGEVQVYGLHSDGLVYLAASAAASVGDLLIPNSTYGRGALETCGPPTTHTTTATGVGINGIAGLAVVVSAVASATATQTSAPSVFLRCM